MIMRHSGLQGTDISGWSDGERLTFLRSGGLFHGEVCVCGWVGGGYKSSTVSTASTASTAFTASTVSTAFAATKASTAVKASQANNTFLEGVRQ